MILSHPIHIFHKLFTSSEGIQIPIEVEWLRFINSHRSAYLDAFFKFITDSVGPISFGIAILFLLIALFKKDAILKRQVFYLITALIISVIITHLLKHLIARPRPFVSYDFIEKLSGGGSYSFPSGHSSDAFTLAIALSLIFPKKWLVFFLILWAFLVGYTRMYFGVHYPTDVIAGAAIGIASAASCYYYFSKRAAKKAMKKPK